MEKLEKDFFLVKRVLIYKIQKENLKVTFLKVQEQEHPPMPMIFLITNVVPSKKIIKRTRKTGGPPF